MTWTRTVRPLFAAFLFLSAGAWAAAQTTVPALLNEGNRGLAEKHYQDAVTAFQSAVDLEPTNAYALIGLAQAQYQAGRTSDSVFTGSANFGDAKDLLEQVLGADPDNFEANVALAKMISDQFLPAFMQARNQAGMKPDQHEPLPYGDARTNLYGQFGALVNEGIERAERATTLRPNSSYAALHTLSGLFLMRSAMDPTPEQSNTDLEKSKEWQAKAEATMQQGAQRQAMIAGAPPPPPPANAMAPPGTVRIGGKVAEANLIQKVEPTYPPLAKSAGVQGTVEFTVVINKEGRVENLQLVRGHPLLVNAAKEAVVQWQYRPTLLNGNPVSVVTTVQVDFHLAVAQQ